MLLVDDPECPNIAGNATRPLLYPVELWRHNASINYFSASQIRDSRVEVITWYKSTWRMEHEYLVMECHRPGDVIFYLRIERQPGEMSLPEEASPSQTNDTTPVQQQLPRKDPYKRTLWTVLQKLSHHSKPTVFALDSVSQALDSTGSFGLEAQKIAQYCAFRKPLFVRDLAFLSCVVHSHQRNYQLFLYQCYWYCRTIADVVTAEYEPTVVRGEHFEKAGTYTISKRWLGSQRLTVNQPCENEVYQIRKDFEAALEAHNAEVRRKEDEQSRR